MVDCLVAWRRSQQWLDHIQVTSIPETQNLDIFTPQTTYYIIALFRSEGQQNPD